MPWQYVGQQTIFGPGMIWFQEKMTPGTWVRVEIPLVPDQYAQQWGVAFAWTNSDEIPGSGLSVLVPSILLYHKRHIFRLRETPQGLVRLGVYVTRGEQLEVQDVIVNRWQP